MGHIAIPAPANLFIAETIRDSYSTETSRDAGIPVVAVYVPRDPSHTDAVFYVLGNGEIVRADSVDVRVFNGSEDIEKALDEIDSAVRTLELSTTVECNHP